MSYGSEVMEDLLFAFDADGCSNVFGHLLAAAQIDHEHRDRRSTIAFGAAFT